MPDTPVARRSTRVRRCIPDILGIAWVLAAAGAVLAPAFTHGASLGSSDWLSQFGLSKQLGVVVHDHQAFDQATEMIPWASLSWTQVHHGLLPLWNPYSALGTPLAFNWQAASFSLPALVSYLFPLHLVYTVQIVVTLAVAGTGVYVLGRVLRLGVLGCVMAATAYELSGSLFAWLGWPVASVMSWAGWLLAAALLVIRGRHRARAIGCFAVVVALAIYAGQPDALVLLATAAGVFVVALLVLRTPALGGSGAIGRPLFDFVVATGAGAALGAPLLLPGAQLFETSVRGAKGFTQALPVGDLSYLFLQGFNGLPLAGTHWFGPSFYIRTASYVGVIAVVLAVVALGTSLPRFQRRPEVVALGAVVVVTVGLVVVPPIVLGAVQWHRALLPLDFALAVLAGVGTDIVVRTRAGRTTLSLAAIGFGIAGLLVAAVFLFARGQLSPADAAIRARSFVWPAAEVALGLAVVAVLAVVGRRSGRGTHAPRRRSGAGAWAAAVLLACETAFLVTSGASLWTATPDLAAPTPAETALAHTVGSALVGLGKSTCFTSAQLGMVPDANVALEIREFAAYDPLLPDAYSPSWPDETGPTPGQHPPRSVPFSVFCPAITSVSEARRYGIGFVLEPSGTSGPPGSRLVRRVGGEGLYRIPGAGAATVVPLAASGALPPLDAPGVPVVVTHPDPASWALVTHSTGDAVVRLRLTDVPGWHASIDGRPLALQRYGNVMLEARVPAGTHTIELHYLPVAFTAGVALAGVAVIALVGMPLVARLRRRAPPGPEDGA
ncbi:MAG: YfhO family protein [Acidimicrobiales bacterium]